MPEFKPCQGKTACRDNGTHCLTCGREVNEIERLRQLIDQLATLAIDYEYKNLYEFSSYVAKKVQKTVSYRQ